ncbi:cold-shock protein [Seonamhaeicola aphaedonensis]|uniref:Putative cold-shock DNA-binding protein n=1 Tax=Seonamhaeicola aphaedonensis TaxID=1461338 RepID=A0A3D9HJY4_9FLAO|nr:cold shock domain-containing protein [Seonamhaeicola aphaedonensis]RED49591.1 putative cold-shock DNA-binding protein [Seonamhaeicola aphaedonensis]
MAKSQQSYIKREKEKKQQQKREEKQKKREARKAEKKDNNDGIPFAYVDKLGNLTDIPPDRSQKEEIEASEIELGIPKRVNLEKIEPIRNGKMEFFNHSKGFGFIMDTESKEKYFCHISNLKDEVSEGDKVKFEIEKSSKGQSAINVELL